jgi:hypothetical protein
VSLQRSRGVLVKVWPTHTITDQRGNTVVAANMDAEPYVVSAAAIPQRSSRAEVPGQQEINVVRLIVDPDLPDVNLWARVEYLGEQWDVISPPAYHHGSRRVRHWSLDIRKRPVHG